MTAYDIVGLVLTVAGLVYLFVALVRGDKVG